MIIHSGVYFHSPNDFRSFYSNDALFTTLNIANKFGQLVKPEGNTIEVGTKYFFSFPITHGMQNWVVFGIGETVYTLQPERKGSVRVPYIQLFLVPLYDYVSAGLVIDPKKLEKFCRPYQEVFDEYVQNNRTVKCATFNETIGNKNDNPQPILNEYKNEKSQKIFTDNYDEATKQYYDNIRRYSKIIRWAYSTMITPLDEMYSLNFVLVYPQKPNRIEKPEAQETISIPDEKAYQDFDYFLKQNSENIESFLNTERLDEIYLFYNEFFKKKTQTPQETPKTTGQDTPKNPPIHIPIYTSQVNSPNAVAPRSETNSPAEISTSEAEREINRELNAIVRSVSRISDLQKKIVTTDEASKQISSAISQTRRSIENSQNLEVAMESIRASINTISEAIENVKDNKDRFLLGDSVGEAYDALADYCNEIKEKIERKRDGFSTINEKTLTDFMKDTGAGIAVAYRNYQNKTEKPISRLTSTLKGIFIAAEKAKHIETTERFKKHLSDYFEIKSNRDIIHEFRK